MLDPEQYEDAASAARVAENELKETLEGLAEHLFGKGIEVSSPPQISMKTLSSKAVSSPAIF